MAGHLLCIFTGKHPKRCQSNSCELEQFIDVRIIVSQLFFCCCFLLNTNIMCFFSQLKGALKSREREISSLRRQLDASQDELSGIRRERELTVQENRRLKDDLVTMTRENQVRNETFA